MELIFSGNICTFPFPALFSIFLILSVFITASMRLSGGLLITISPVSFSFTEYPLLTSSSRAGRKDVLHHLEMSLLFAPMISPHCPGLAERCSLGSNAQKMPFAVGLDRILQRSAKANWYDSFDSSKGGIRKRTGEILTRFPKGPLRGIISVFHRGP